MRQLALTAALLLPLSLDTFALAAGLGVAGLEPRHRLRVALIFTVFEAGMPILGLLVGGALSRYLGEWAGYAGIAVLLVAGLLLARGGDGEDAEARRLRLLARARGLAILDLGLGISVDELTVGFSAGLLAVPIALAVAWIAIQAFLAAQAGMRLGSRVGARLRERLERAAGIALVVVAVALLVARIAGAT